MFRGSSVPVGGRGRFDAAPACCDCCWERVVWCCLLGVVPSAPPPSAVRLDARPRGGALAPLSLIVAGWPPAAAGRPGLVCWSSPETAASTWRAPPSAAARVPVALAASATSNAPPCVVSVFCCVFRCRCECGCVSSRSSSLVRSFVCVCGAAPCACRVPGAGEGLCVGSSPMFVVLSSRAVCCRGSSSSRPPRRALFMSCWYCRSSGCWRLMMPSCPRHRPWRISPQ